MFHTHAHIYEKFMNLINDDIHMYIIKLSYQGQRHHLSRICLGMQRHSDTIEKLLKYTRIVGKRLQNNLKLQINCELGPISRLKPWQQSFFFRQHHAREILIQINIHTHKKQIRIFTYKDRLICFSRHICASYRNSSA